MKKEIFKNIEKVYRVKGRREVFESAEKAAEFAQTKLLKEYEDDIWRYRHFNKDYNEQIEKLRIFYRQRKLEDSIIKKEWFILENYGSLFLCSNATDIRIKLTFNLDLSYKRDLCFARELVRCYYKKSVNVLSKKIRENKVKIRNAQKWYSELRELV